MKVSQGHGLIGPLVAFLFLDQALDSVDLAFAIGAQDMGLFLVLEFHLLELLPKLMGELLSQLQV